MKSGEESEIEKLIEKYELANTNIDLLKDKLEGDSLQYDISDQDIQMIQLIIPSLQGRYTLDEVLIIKRRFPHKDPAELMDYLLNQKVDVNEIRNSERGLMMKSSAPLVECTLCFDCYPAFDMFNLGCPKLHSYCYDCLKQMISISVNEGSQPYCPSQLNGSSFDLSSHNL